MSEWSRKTIQDLIKEYKEHPVLYDCKNSLVIKIF